MGLKRKQIYLNTELEDALGKLALSTGRSESSIIREALAEYVAAAAEKAGEEGNPLSKLRGLCIHCDSADGSTEHDRDLYGHGRA